MLCTARVLIFISAILAGTVPGVAGRDPVVAADRIYFSVLNKEEKPVTGLTAADFELRVNGKLAPMEGFHAGLPPVDRSIPLVAWILIDFNPHVSEAMIRNQAGAAAAVFGMLNPESALGVKLVSDQSETLAPLAHDPAGLRDAFLQFGQRRTERRVGLSRNSADVGDVGIARAMELALDEMDSYIASSPSLNGRELHRAIMIISDGNLNPAYNLKRFYARAAREGLFLYPVFVPRPTYGDWVRDYFDLAKKTAGVASVFGAIRPGSEMLPLPRSEVNQNALNANFIHMTRDLNGKYSFEVPLTSTGKEMRIKLKCKVKGIKIRLPRTIVP